MWKTFLLHFRFYPSDKPTLPNKNLHESSLLATSGEQSTCKRKIVSPWWVSNCVWSHILPSFSQPQTCANKRRQQDPNGVTWAKTHVTNQRLDVKASESVSRSAVSHSAAPQTVAHQAPLSMDFPGKSAGMSSHSLLQGSSWPKDCTWVSFTAGRSLPLGHLRSPGDLTLNYRFSLSQEWNLKKSIWNDLVSSNEVICQIRPLLSPKGRWHCHNYI